MGCVAMEVSSKDLQLGSHILLLFYPLFLTLQSFAGSVLLVQNSELMIQYHEFCTDKSILSLFILIGSLRGHWYEWNLCGAVLNMLGSIPFLQRLPAESFQQITQVSQLQHFGNNLFTKLDGLITCKWPKSLICKTVFRSHSDLLNCKFCRLNSLFALH